MNDAENLVKLLGHLKPELFRQGICPMERNVISTTGRSIAAASCR